MANSDTLTDWLLVAFGLYSLAAGLGGLVRPDRWRAMIAQMEGNDALTFIVGITVFALGMAILLAHPCGGSIKQWIVTAIAAVMVVEGLVFLAAPGLLFAVSKPLLAGNVRPWALFAIFLGLLGCVVGLTSIV